MSTIHLVLRKLASWRHEWLYQGHASKKWQKWDSNPDLSDCRISVSRTQTALIVINTQLPWFTFTTLPSTPWIQWTQILTDVKYFFPTQMIHQKSKWDSLFKPLYESSYTNLEIREKNKARDYHMSQLPAPESWSLKNLWTEPWLVWLSGLSAGLWTKGSWFDSRSGHGPALQARSPVWVCAKGNHTLMFLSLSFSFPSLLSENK